MLYGKQAMPALQDNQPQGSVPLLDMNYISVPKGLLPRVALNAYSDSGAAAKDAFHRAGKAFLRKVAQELGLQPSDYRLSNNVAGIAVSGEVTLHSDDLYVQLHESCVGPSGVSVLFRGCDSRKDCCGHQNNFASMQRLADEDEQKRFMRHLSEIINRNRARKAGKASANAGASTAAAPVAA